MQLKNWQYKIPNEMGHKQQQNRVENGQNGMNDEKQLIVVTYKRTKQNDNKIKGKKKRKTGKLFRYFSNNGVMSSGCLYIISQS